MKTRRLARDRTPDGLQRAYPNEPGACMTLRLRYRTLKLRALCWLLRRLRAGRDRLSRLDRGVVSSRRKTIRAVITRTIIDGSTVDIRESSGVSDGKLATRLIEKSHFLGLCRIRRLSPHALRQQSERHRVRDVGLGISSKLRPNLARHMMKSWSVTGATPGGCR